jgi:hypothetical protein
MSLIILTRDPAPSALDDVTPQQLTHVLRVGVTWLTAITQPIGAISDSHGPKARLGSHASAAFAPARPHQGRPGSAVVVVDAGYTRMLGRYESLRLTQEDCDRVAETLAAVGADVYDSWNGAGYQHGSWAITGISPTLARAVDHYREGCPQHRTVFCGGWQASTGQERCTWYRTGAALLAKPLFTHSLPRRNHGT